MSWLAVCSVVLMVSVVTRANEEQTDSLIQQGKYLIYSSHSTLYTILLYVQNLQNHIVYVAAISKLHLHMTEYCFMVVLSSKAVCQLYSVKNMLLALYDWLIVICVHISCVDSC